MPDVAGRVADEFEARIREHEESWLSPLAVRSYATGGRAEEEEEECRLRTPFQRDRDRIVHCKAFRRLRHKTQVFIDPRGDHYRTRLTHTLETAGISRTVARALRLNEDLTEAIALGHDLGHAPFGHTGEEALDEALAARFGRHFRHNEQSLRVVEILERDGRGLNLTVETRDGILNHTGPNEPATLEGKIVRLVDRVAYINHDIDDALRAGVLRADELPREEIALLGERGSRRIDTLVHDIVEASAQADDIVQSEEIGRAMLDLRAFMFERVYLGPAAESQRALAVETVRRIFDRLVEHPDELPREEIALLGERGSRRIDTLVHDIVEASAGSGDIVQSEQIGRAMLDLRAFMFERVYLGPAAEEQRALAVATVRRIFDRLVEHPDELPPDRPGDLAERVTDYVAGMTDRFALAWR
jgi:dGTPase